MEISVMRKKRKIVDLDLPEIEKIINKQDRELEGWKKSWRWFFIAGFIVGVLFVIALNLIIKL